MKDSKRNRRNQKAKAQKRAEYYKPRTVSSPSKGITLDSMSEETPATWAESQGEA